MPFRPYAIAFFNFYDFSPTTTDAMERVKKEYPQYDVVVMNLFNQIFLDLIHPDLVQDLLSMENIPNYTKTDFEISNFKRSVGEGLPLSEDKAWKMKRKVLNSVFNFDFIKSLTPKIATLCDGILDRMDERFGNNEIEYDVSDYTK